MYTVMIKLWFRSRIVLKKCLMDLMELVSSSGSPTELHPGPLFIPIHFLKTKCEILVTLGQSLPLSDLDLDLEQGSATRGFGAACSSLIPLMRLLEIINEHLFKIYFILVCSFLNKSLVPLR